ncbi:transmembrane protein 132C [Pteropus medius]|uniref:transmembrane protein 132C n=1 Tax=Pteropus vampyrus TaxID=132908 RepID=UPI00196B53E1|nr:transmembrane protein 132C [Pteropus giganteus]
MTGRSEPSDLLSGGRHGAPSLTGRPVHQRWARFVRGARAIAARAALRGRAVLVLMPVLGGGRWFPSPRISELFSCEPAVACSSGECVLVSFNATFIDSVIKTAARDIRPSLRRANIQNTATSHAGERTRHRGFPSPPVAMRNGAAAPEDPSAASHKAEQSLIPYPAVALLGIYPMIEGRGVADTAQRFSSLPPYLPVTYRVHHADVSFFLREADQDVVRNSSLQSRVESFFTYRARRPPILNASFGPFAVEKVVPLDLMLISNFLGPTNEFGLNWRLQAHILRDRVYRSRPTVQVLFHVVGRDWAERGPEERLPCLRAFAFRETREVRGGCRLQGALGLCVAALELPSGWFGPPTVLAGRRRPADPAEGSAVELYYAVHAADERGDCAGGDVRKGNAIRPGKDGLEDATSRLQRIGAVGLFPAQDSSAQLSELRLDGNVAISVPSGPVKQGDVVTAYVTVASNSTVDFFILRAKVKKGVNVLSPRTSQPRQWDVKQELGDSGKHATATVVCQRLGPSARNRSSGSFHEVVQMNFEIASFSSLSGTQPITWQVEYPRKGTTDLAVSEVFISQKDLVGIVPLAMDTEILNTAMLTGKTVALPVKVVSVEESGAVADISEAVECRSADEDVLKVLSPLSDSILAEKTVTVLEDKVSVTDLAIQLVAGLSVTLHPGVESSKAVTAVATAQDLLRTPKQEAVLSTWLQFSDGSVTPLDIYDAKDFTLTASSLDEAVVSVPQARSPWWPVVVAEGEGQGPLVRVDLTISEVCQKSKRKSVLAVGVGNVRVKFGQNDRAPSPGGDHEEGEIRNHASGRRQQGQHGHAQGGRPAEREEGVLLRGGPTAESLRGSEAARSGRLDGGQPPGEAQLQDIPLDLANFPGQADLPRAGASGPVQAARGLSDLEIGMYALLGVFCLAILVFLVNCATFALKYRHKQLPPEGQASVTHSHDWVWLGNEAELLESAGKGSPPPDERTTAVDRGPGDRGGSSRLLLHGGQQRVQGQVHRPGWGQKREPGCSPASRRKKVKFTTFTTIPADDGRPTVNSILGGQDEDIKWVCRDLDAGAPRGLRNYLEKFKDSV